MNIPNLPHEKPIDEHGQWTASWFLWFQQLISVLQKNFSEEGFQLPCKPTNIINALARATTTGALIYDATTDQFKGNVKGMFKVINMS